MKELVVRIECSWTRHCFRSWITWTISLLCSNFSSCLVLFNCIDIRIICSRARLVHLVPMISRRWSKFHRYLTSCGNKIYALILSWTRAIFHSILAKLIPHWTSKAKLRSIFIPSIYVILSRSRLVMNICSTTGSS